MEDQGKAFEDWYIKTHDYDTVAGDGQGGFASVDAGFAWEAWQAAIRHTQDSKKDQE